MFILKVGDKGYIGRDEPDGMRAIQGIPSVGSRRQAIRFHREEKAFRYAVMYQEMLNKNGISCTVPKMLIERRLELSKHILFWMKK